ncbi:hypothetical protein PRZ48_013983 [Zasmidium cellare]|uniref:Phytanoyl-CoA dioxygenase n=1 Tax=Zasmidium cellare TaxID=395010 RepID=A0ABR0DZQ5_ZASCE|nr:hypothetical protein PRZ48_013983 [Zasmidium cellare]
MSCASLSAEEITRFNRDGYLILSFERHGLVPDINILQHYLDQVYQWPHEKANWRLYYEDSNIHGERILLGTERIIDDHDGLKSILCSQGAHDLLRQLTGKEMLLFKDEIDWKLPGRKGAIAHIDLPAYGHKATRFVEVMIAVDPHTSENGCMQCVPGSQNEDLPYAENGAVDKGWVDAHRDDFRPIHLNAGDLLLFGERLCHRLDPNHSQQARRTLFGTYHYELDRPHLREEFFAHRLAHAPPSNA